MSLFANDKIEVAHQPKITSIKLDYKDWQLYNDGSNGNMAKYLNNMLAECVEDGLSKYDTYHVMRDIMLSPQFVEIGAGDTEPRHVLDDLLDKIFPDNA